MKKRRLKPKILGIPIKTWARFVCYFVVLLIFFGFTIALLVRKNSLLDQLEGKRWSDEGAASQVSVFFKDSAGFNHDNVLEWRFNINKQLQSKSVEEPAVGARWFADSYASMGFISMSTEYATADVNAYGVGGDFFLFHPVSLLYGGYFSESDLMQDAVVLDEETAWKLYGSSDIVGKTVDIGGNLHRIVGVYRHQKGKLYEMAGGDEALCYVSYDTMKSFGTGENILFYEAVMPNLVKGFSLQIMKDSVTVNEKDAMFIDNSARFSYENLYEVLKQKDSRIMRRDTYVFPTWENVARVVEGRTAVIAVWQVVFLLIFIIAVSTELIVFIYKHKITKKMIEDKWERIVENYRRKKTAKIEKKGKQDEK